MAASLGVTTQQLDDMMRKGQVLASDALPKFAAMLNVITNDINLDSLQMSLNKLKNTWYELVENSGSEDIFNKIVRGADKAVGYIAHNMDDIKSLFKSLAISVAGIKMWDYFKTQGDKYLADLERQMRGAERKLSYFQKNIDKLVKEDSIRGPKTREGGLIVGTGGGIDKGAVRDLVLYNEQLIKANQLQNKLYGTPLFDAKVIRDVQAFHRSLGVIPETTGKITAATSALKKVWTGFGVVMKNVGKAFMQFLPMLAFTAVVTIITTAIDRAKRLREQIERINGLIDEQERKISDVKTRAQEQVTLMEGYMQALIDTNRTEDERLKTLNKINELMGTNFDASAINETSDAYKELTRQTNLWGQSLAIAAELQAYAQSRADNLIAIEKIKAELARKEAEYNKKTTVSRNWKGEYVRMNKLPFNGAQTLKKEMANDKKELEILQGLADGAVSKIAELETAYESIVTEMNKGRKGGGGGGGESKLAKVLEKFNEEKAELTNKLREGAIQQEEFNKELDKLVLKYWESAAATGELSIKDILSKMDKGQALTAMEKWYKDLREAAETAARQVVLDGVAEAIAEEVGKAIEDESEALKKELEDWAEKDTKRIAADTAGMVHEKTPLKTRDGLFDYKKSDREIFSDAANVARENAKTRKEDIDAINEKYEKGAEKAQGVIDKLNEMEAEYKDLVKSADSFEQAARYAELIEDIKSMRKALTETVTSGVKNLATSLDRCIKGAQELRDVFEDTDSSEWDKFMAVFNELVQVLDTFMGIMETVQKLGQITEQLNNAELTAQREKIVLLETELQLRKQLQDLKEKESSQTNKIIAQNLLAMATSKSAASASAGEAVAGATASGSKLPFPANIAAIAAGVGAVILALSKMNKFANGGIVGGNSFSGDKQMARVNSGEMVLNKAQQGHLWNILNGKGGTGGNVQFTIRGADLVGTLNNYRRLTNGRG